MEHDRRTHFLEVLEDDVKRYAGRIPRWSFMLAVLVVGALLSLLSHNLIVGPRWAVPVVVLALLAGVAFSVMRGRHDLTRRFALSLAAVLTAGMVTSVTFLVLALLRHTEPALALFRDAALLWAANIGLFAIWYWEIDRGGPIRRHVGDTQAPDFLFPQMVAEVEGWAGWQPHFVDYVFQAFNTSTAFSPTDTMTLSGRAKLLMMTQSVISLVIVAVLAARAINIV